MLTVEPPLKLKTELATDLEQTQLECYVTVGAENVRHCACIPIITDEVDPELALRVVAEFADAAIGTRLSLTTGALKFEYF